MTWTASGDNVLVHGGCELPMSDAQINLLEERRAVHMTGWEGQEARYGLSQDWLEGCAALGADPLTACLVVLDCNRGELVL